MKQSELEDLLKQGGYTIESKSVIDVKDDNETPIASLFIEDKYIQFHEQFTQIGITMPLFHQLMNEEGWKSNHC